MLFLIFFCRHPISHQAKPFMDESQLASAQHPSWRQAKSKSPIMRGPLNKWTLVVFMRTKISKWKTQFFSGLVELKVCVSYCCYSILVEEMIPVHGAHSALRLYPTQTINFPTTFKKAVFNSIQIIFFFSNGFKGYGQRCHSINISFQFNLFHHGREEEFHGQMGKPCSVIGLLHSLSPIVYRSKTPKV